MKLGIRRPLYAEEDLSEATVDHERRVAANDDTSSQATFKGFSIAESTIPSEGCVVKCAVFGRNGP